MGEFLTSQAVAVQSITALSTACTTQLVHTAQLA